MAMWWQGKIDLCVGDTALAVVHLHDALSAFKSFEMNMEVIDVLEDHARLASRSHLSKRAVQLYGAVSAARERLALRRSSRSEARW